jgi:carbon-monoxide dehydrogenase small subunit
MTCHVSALINGGQTDRDIDPRLSLGDFLRDDCGLTGTHLACEHGVCGACTVLVNDEPVRSCIFYAVQAHGLEVRTIEGFDDDEIMRRLRAAFSAHHALQCGFCTAGMLITGRDIIKRLGPVDEERLREELSGNLCRCTGYVGVVKAIQEVAAETAHSIRRDSAADARSVLLQNVPADSQVTGQSNRKPAEAENVAPPAVPAAGVARSGTGGFSVKRSMAIAFPVELVWREFSDPSEIAACLPGAELKQRDGDRLLGGVHIKMGPIKAQFIGEANYALEERTRSGSLIGGGRDTLSNSRASGELHFRMSPGPQDTTALDIELTFTLQGMLAQFSRPAIVNDFTSFIMERFLENLSYRLKNPGEATKAAATSLSFMSMLRWRAVQLWRRLVRKSR